MFTSLSGELNELAIYEAGYQLSLFDSLLPDFVADVHPLVGISSDALYAAAMARPFQGRLLSEWASDLEADRLRRITNTVRQVFCWGIPMSRSQEKFGDMSVRISGWCIADEPG
ncbi:hypothetical protein EH64_23205 [Escherichia coli]|nr:hypothetical protein EH64_23205 [Escherichia coli]